MNNTHESEESPRHSSKGREQRFQGSSLFSPKSIHSRQSPAQSSSRWKAEKVINDTNISSSFFVSNADKSAANSNGNSNYGAILPPINAHRSFQNQPDSEPHNDISRDSSKGRNLGPEPFGQPAVNNRVNINALQRDIQQKAYNSHEQDDLNRTGDSRSRQGGLRAAHQRNASAADHSANFDHNRNSIDTCEADESLAL